MGLEYESSSIQSAIEESDGIIRRLMAEHDAMHASLRALQHENTRLRHELALNKAVVQDHLVHECEESEESFARYAQLEEQNSHLANLYVATHLLHAALDRPSVLGAIEEIIVNFIGSEEFAVFERGRNGEFRRITACGVSDVASIQRDVHIARSIGSGERWVRPEGLDTPLSACVPLKVDGYVTGYVAIYGLLPHKESLQAMDFELFDILTAHAGTALYCATLEEKARRAQRRSA